MTQDSTTLRMSAFWAPWEYIMEMHSELFSSTMNYLQYHVWHQCSHRPFLRKLQRYAAKLQDFLIHTTKHAVTECTEYMRDLRLAKSFQILPTYPSTKYEI
jgi:hypothetical protein